MFTLKLYRHELPAAAGTDESLDKIIHAIQCPHYRVHERASGAITLTVFRDYLSTEGVEYQLGEGGPCFEHCYVENMAGKTIAHYQAVPGLRISEGGKAA